LKQLIDEFIKQNETVSDFLNNTARDFENPDNVIPLFADFLTRTNYNTALGVDFANILQLSNDSNIFERYTLSDISRLFDSLLKIQDFNLETYIEAANYEWAVMDDKEKARSIVMKGIQIAREKMEELEELLETIDND
jgi:signal transduction histidine kinase